MNKVKPPRRSVGDTFYDHYMHPWRTLRNLGHIDVVWERNRDRPGETDGATIWLDKDLQQTERRCVLAHELVHVLRGHTECQSTAAEIGVRVETARRLIPLEDLLTAARWAMTLEELAEELWVIPVVAQDRLNHLTTEERRQLNDSLQH